ncbi:MAG TPA: hypothetical protein V6C57_13975, partial [Coleofasciculaceae cyanobacterium]
MAEQQAKQKRVRQNQASGVLFARFLPHKRVPTGKVKHEVSERSPQSTSMDGTPVEKISDPLPLSENGDAAIQAADPVPPSSFPNQPLPPDQPSPPQKPKPQKPKPWRWSLLWLAILGVCGGMGTSALLWLVTLPPPPNCSNPAQLTLDGERLYCAREAARDGELSKVIAGLDLIKQWDSDHPLQGEAQKLREDWSKRLFKLAQEKVDQSDMKGAMAIISHIPKNAEIYADVQKTVVRWKKQWQAGEAIATKAQTAMKQQKW